MFVRRDFTKGQVWLSSENGDYFEYIKDAYQSGVNLVNAGKIDRFDILTEDGEVVCRDESWSADEYEEVGLDRNGDNPKYADCWERKE